MNDAASGDSSEQSRIRFLDNELDLCHTLLDTAVLEDDSPANALDARSKAQTGYNVVLTWIDSIRNTKERNRLMTRLFDLKKRLDDFAMVGSAKKQSANSE